jgi:antitoxin (DNA-binding transcriptional repressor) of toxin-antitoxin stability system
VKNDLSKYLRLAEQEAIVITRHGKPAGILASSLRMRGSSTAWSTIRAFSNGSKKRVRIFKQSAALA